MSARKRNDFLDADDSDVDLDNGYNSEAEEGRAAIGGHPAKRRRLRLDSRASVDDSEDEDNAHEYAASSDARKSKVADGRFNTAIICNDEDVGSNEDEEDEADHQSGKDFEVVKLRAEKEAAKAQKTVRKSGVVYISRVPPFMKPQTLKHFLEPHARKGIGRIFLTPEDHVAHAKRVKSGGNKKKSFTDGWVEFISKTDAKVAADTLNGNIIGGKKGNFYHDDLWNLKYLKSFKWHHLTEQIANENAERAARIREEIRKSRKENKAFAEDVERAKMLEGMEKKKKAKREEEGKPLALDEQGGKQGREFKQRKAQHHNAPDTGRISSADVKKSLRKIF